jgi:hypothetical protein
MAHPFGVSSTSLLRREKRRKKANNKTNNNARLHSGPRLECIAAVGGPCLGMESTYNKAEKCA